MHDRLGHGWKLGAWLLMAVVLAGCSSRVRSPAPVEDRGSSARAATPPVAAAPDQPAKPPTATDNAGKPGFYTVRAGDTLIRVALESGQNWRDLVRWNNIENPNVIEVGQVLRVLPPTGPQGTDVATSRTVAPVVVTAPSVPASGTASPAASAPKVPASATVASIPPTNGQGPIPGGEEELAWAWPIAGAGSVLAGFDEQKNKGLDIGGRSGDAVLASADGRVVYAGAGLRGYGNLIILKHNNTYLSAYAHNQTLLVKEDQAVRKGQKIAEMGSSDADRVKLHFEIRRQGKPVDPSRYLPAR